jgi:hypothetical protein
MPVVVAVKVTVAEVVLTGENVPLTGNTDHVLVSRALGMATLPAVYPVAAYVFAVPLAIEVAAGDTVILDSG